eukprot:32553-Rhodomonas_salina.4
MLALGELLVETPEHLRTHPHPKRVTKRPSNTSNRRLQRRQDGSESSRTIGYGGAKRTCTIPRVAAHTGSEKSPPAGDTAPTMVTEPVRCEHASQFHNGRKREGKVCSPLRDHIQAEHITNFGRRTDLGVAEALDLASALVEGRQTRRKVRRVPLELQGPHPKSVQKRRTGRTARYEASAGQDGACACGQRQALQDLGTAVGRNWVDRCA